MNMPVTLSYQIEQQFADFINQEVLPKTNLKSADFWPGLIAILEDLTPTNDSLLNERERIQQALNTYYQEQDGTPDMAEYKAFLKEIGYLCDDIEDFTITPNNVDSEITDICGPQLVVPVDNARFVLNAANARWGSLYDALYGTDVIPHTAELAPTGGYNPKRGEKVIGFARDFLDQIFPLNHGSHRDVTCYTVYFQHLLAYFEDGTSAGLLTPAQFAGFSGDINAPSSVLFKNNGLHVELQINRAGTIGKTDRAGIDDIRVEAAITTIVDFEDSVSAVDAEDKIRAYRNWLGLMQGSLTARFDKGDETIFRQMQRDRMFSAKDGDSYPLKGRALLMVRNVGHLMKTDLILNEQSESCFEGLIDAVVTSLIASIDLASQQNSKTGSIYIVKPKMHGPKEVAFTCQLFERVEALLELEPNTIKLGIMDEERRTTVNLKQCIYEARERVFFINTGFLDRTGDEIHTSMQAGPFLPKEEIKRQAWISAYENWNVDMGLKTGFKGRAQIGKGMWAMPDEMARMMLEKTGHPKAGANTAWVPSPTAATLHALHYHSIDVSKVQLSLAERKTAKLDDILTLPLLQRHLSKEDIADELENNIQGILGYMVRWVELGIGCSKVPDINDIGLMEDRATLRISSQHIANWLRHGICTEQEVLATMQRMASVVDKQNRYTPNYIPMAPEFDKSVAFSAARDLIFNGCDQPNGYTEPVLHSYRQKLKSQTR